MEIFGCCSSCVECSDIGKCIHLGDQEYEGCYYRKNLEAGKIFYGKNAFKYRLKQADVSDNKGDKEDMQTHVTIAAVDAPADAYAIADVRAQVNDINSQKIKNIREIYLDGKGRQFNILIRLKGLSYRLDTEQANKIFGELETLKIPIATEQSVDKCRMDTPTIENPEYACYRIFATLAGLEVNILNYNSCLLQRVTCEKISEYLRSKGVHNSVELVGTRKNVEFKASGSILVNAVDSLKETNRNMVSKSTGYEPKVGEQLSIFKMGVGLYGY